MDRPLTVWAMMTFRLALVLLAIGILPALVVQYLLPDIDALIPALLLFSVTPLGVLALAVSIILYLVAVARRSGGSS
jgi:hypothetical protein